MKRLTEELKGVHPLPGNCTADDVAKAALFLASDDSRYISGQALAIDGAAGAGRSWTAFVEQTLMPAFAAQAED